MNSDRPPPILPAFIGPILANEYRCDHCRGVFAFGWSEEEADAEELATFGYNSDGEGRSTLCDHCWQSFMAFTQKHTDCPASETARPAASQPPSPRALGQASL